MSNPHPSAGEDSGQHVPAPAINSAPLYSADGMGARQVRIAEPFGEATNTLGFRPGTSDEPMGHALSGGYEDQSPGTENIGQVYPGAVHVDQVGYNGPGPVYPGDEHEIYPSAEHVGEVPPTGDLADTSMELPQGGAQAHLIDTEHFVQTPASGVSPLDHPAATENEEPKDYFDWINDADVDEKNRTEQQAQRKLRLRRMTTRRAIMLLFSTFLGNLVLVGILLVPVLVVRFVYRREHGDLVHQDYVADNVEAWFIWAAFNLHFQWWIHMLVELIPAALLGLVRLTWGKPNQDLLGHVEYYDVNKLYIKLVFYAALNWGSWAIIFNSCYDLYTRQDPSHNSRATYTARIYQVMEFIFFLVLTFCVEKIIIRLISMSFHKTAYAERIQHITHILKTLDHLYDHRPKKITQGRSRGSSAAEIPLFGQKSGGAQVQRQRIRARIAAASSRTRNKIKSSSAYAAKLASVGMRDPAQLLRAEQIGVSLDLNSPAMAKRLARSIFESYRGASKRTYLVPSDFATAYPDQQAANTAFAVFDVDGNGDISQSEIKNIVMFAYKDRRALTHAMNDVNHAVKSLDLILSVIAMIFVLFEALQIFSLNIQQSIATFYSLGIAFAFVFKESAQNVFDSIIFLFVTHPFDTGDLVNVNGDPVFVKKLSLLFSTFVTTTGQIMCVSNAILSSQRVMNYRRSSHQYEETHLQFAYDTPLEKLDAVMDDINNWIARDEEHRFIYPSRMIWHKLEYSRIIDVSVGMLHSHNFQDWGDRLHRQSAFFAAMSYYLRKHGVMYEHGLETAQMHDQDFAAEYDNAFESSTDPENYPQGALPHKFAMHARDVPGALSSRRVSFQHPDWILNSFGMKPDPSFDADDDDEHETHDAPVATAGSKRYMYFAPPDKDQKLRRRLNAGIAHTAGA